MSTVWTKINDKTTEWIDGDFGDLLLTEDEKEILREDELYTLAGEGFAISWGGVSDVDSLWIAQGLELRLVTEGSRDWLMVEGKGFGIILSRSGTWVKTTDQTTVWTKTIDV